MHVLHRFVAVDASAARRQVGATLGKDAVLLSCRDVEEGIEIIAIPGTGHRSMAGLMRNAGSRRHAHPGPGGRAIPTVHEVA